MEARNWSEAREAFHEASKRIPKDPRPYVQLGWARFLAGNSEKRVAPTSIKEIQVALSHQPDFDVAWLYMGKIHRLAGDAVAAEAALRKAIHFNARNGEAQSELRLIFSRELGTPGKRLNLGIDPRIAGIIGLVLAACVGLFFLANKVSGGATLWPDTGAARAGGQGDAELKEVGQLVNLRLHHDGPTLVAAAKEMGAKADVATKEQALAYLGNLNIDEVYKVIAQVRKVPPEMQVLGNVEFYYLSDDSFWWLRRVALLILGLIGIFGVGRRLDLGKGGSILGEQHGWLGAAIPYGIVVGFLSGILPTVTPFGMLLAMTFFHVLCEQIFFSGFVNRGLLALTENKPLAVAMGAGIYGVYQLTYFAVLNQPIGNILIDVLQIGAFAGGAYALLLWRSGGLLAPFVAHLLINLTMILRSVAN
ncbi:MAG: CPBP family intramembrane metalloprotease, partial [Myxococcales bacterium]|nr:CPBP family intramembrane metalloprotease [Myxococcales bacterium]